MKTKTIELNIEQIETILFSLAHTSNCKNLKNTEHKKVSAMWKMFYDIKN